MDSENFYKALIQRAVTAYCFLQVQLKKHEKYYSEDDTLTWSDVFQANTDAKSNIEIYIDTFKCLHQRHLDSPLDNAQAIRQGLRLLNLYDGQSGNPMQFEQYFVQCLLNLKTNPESYAFEGSESSDDLLDMNNHLKRPFLDAVGLMRKPSDLLPRIIMQEEKQTNDSQEESDYDNFIELDSDDESNEIRPTPATHRYPYQPAIMSSLGFFSSVAKKGCAAKAKENMQLL